MKKKSLLLLLLLALLAPWAANAQTTLWSENFEGGAMPSGWTTDGPGTWSVGSGDYSTSTSAGQGTYNALIKHGTTGSVTKLITPEIDLSSVTSAVLSFMHVQRSWAGDIDELRVYYRTSSSDAWTQLVAYTSAVASWTTEEDIILPNTSATYQLAFEHTDNYGYGVGLDDIRITPPVTCPKPTELTCTAYTTTTATLAWTENGEATSWVLEYGTADDFTGATSVNVSGTPSKELTGLTAETTYYARVKADCGGGDQSDWSNTCEFRPSAAQIVQIGEGESASTYLPAYTFYNNNLTEQLYTAEEVGMAGDIVSLAFYNAGSTKTPNIKIYLVNTDKEAFESTTDWLTVTADDLVFEGNVTFTAGEWTTIHFDNSFYYDGNSNLGLVVDEAMTYSSGLSCRVFTSTDNCSLYHYDDNVDFDATNPSSGYTSNRLSVKNQIQLGIIPGEAPSCPKPTALALTTDGETVTATWNGTASTYNIDINGTVTNNVTSPYTFNCALSTTYTVMVQANCDGGETSDWTNPKSITTPDCIGGRTIEYSLVDSYGDGWNDNTILVVDECGNLINSLTLESGYSISGTLEFCEGYYEFVFLEGSYKDETSWTFTENGVTLFSGAGEDIVSGDVLYALGNPTKPTDLVATINSTSAALRWTENGSATAWQICLDGNEANLIEADSNPFTLTGLNPGAIYCVKVRSVTGGTYTCWSSDYTFVTSETCESPTVPTASDITPFSANIVWTPEQGSFELKYREVAPQDNYFEDGTLGAWTTIDADGDGNTWYPLGEGTIPGYNASMGHVTSASYNGSALTPDNYLVSPQVALGGSFSFWACNQDAYAETIGVAVSTASNDDPADFTMLKTVTLPLARGGAYTTDSRSGNRDQCPWVYFYVDLSAYAGQTGYVAIRHYNCTDKFRVNVDNIVIEQPGDEWTVVSNATSPVALTDLTPETEYEMVLRTVCENNDYSRWMSNTFTTPSNCDAPSELLATPLVTEATLEWTGYQDAYNVRYRKPATTQATEGSIADDFESGTLTGWTVVRNGGGDENTDWRAFTPASFGDETVTAHSGNYVAMSRSWAGDAYSVENWLISPQVTLDGELSYWVLDDGTYHEHYDVYVSTTDTDLTSFSLFYEPGDASDEWTQHTVDLSSYNGVSGYIAFRHIDEDQDFLFIDDVVIGSVETVEYDWNEVQVTGLTTVDITGLEAETEYEWQVQGINRSCDEGVTPWSELMTFTTAGACDDPINLEATDITASSATLNWLGYQDNFNLRYRTAEVIDDINFFDGCSEQGNWTTSNLETENEEGASGWDLFGGYFTFIYTTNPPQYLISPEIEAELNNSTLWFQYYALGGEEYPETFQVGFSSTDNDVNSFTWGDEITATNDDQFLSYVATVPNDAKYFAVKCTSYDAYALVLDNFVICDTYVAPGEWTNLTDVTSPTTIEDLVDNTEYDWEVQGICEEDAYTDWSYSYFTTLEKTNVTQVVELSEGMNWFSTNVKITMDNLKAALVAAAGGTGNIVITSQRNGMSTYNGTRWRGTLNTIDVTQSYRITVATACEITLEGMPLDPDTTVITIKNGANWIGFPLQENMTVVNAFAGFAVSGDVITAQRDGMATYNGSRWRGTLSNGSLKPGQGYVYKSAATDDRPLVFPTAKNAFRNKMGKTLEISNPLSKISKATFKIKK